MRVCQKLWFHSAIITCFRSWWRTSDARHWNVLSGSLWWGLINWVECFFVVYVRSTLLSLAGISMFVSTNSSVSNGVQTNLSLWNRDLSVHVFSQGEMTSSLRTHFRFWLSLTTPTTHRSGFQTRRGVLDSLRFYTLSCNWLISNCCLTLFNLCFTEYQLDEKAGKCTPCARLPDRKRQGERKLATISSRRGRSLRR